MLTNFSCYTKHFMSVALWKDGMLWSSQSITLSHTSLTLQSLHFPFKMCPGETSSTGMTSLTTDSSEPWKMQQSMPYTGHYTTQVQRQRLAICSATYHGNIFLMMLLCILLSILKALYVFCRLAFLCFLDQLSGYAKPSYEQELH